MRRSHRPDARLWRAEERKRREREEWAMALLDRRHNRQPQQTATDHNATAATVDKEP